MKWNKNHITGEEVNVKAYKPNNGRIGKITVELFDDDGKVINETYTENIIPNLSSDNEAYVNMYNKIMTGKYYQDNTNIVENGGTFNNIILGTSDREEDAENIIMDAGEIIGWCPKSDSAAGSDILRGVYNPTESYIECEKGYMHSHLVYDFGTSQGNGTFNSIWWSRKTADNSKFAEVYGEWFNTPGSARNKSAVDEFSYYPGVNGKFFVELLKKNNDVHEIKNPLYFFNNSHQLEYYDKNKYKSIEIPVVHQQIPGTDCHYIKIDNYNQVNGGHSDLKCDFDITLRNKSDEVIDRVSLNIMSDKNRNIYARSTASAMYMKLSSVFKVTEGGNCYMIFDCMCDTSNSNSYYIFPKYFDASDTLGSSASTSDRERYTTVLGIYNIYSKKWIVEPSFDNLEARRISVVGGTVKNFLSYSTMEGVDYYYLKIKTLTGGDFLYKIVETPERPYHYTLTGYNCVDMTSYPLSYSTYYYARFCHIPGTNHFITTSDNYGSSQYNYYLYGDFKFTHAYSAHTKLPNPVTKTSADTMKIQYDYYIQVPKSFSTDGDYLTMPEFIE